MKLAQATTSRIRQSDSAPPAALSDDDLHEQIATAAYFRALERGFEPGHEMSDWLAAEADLSMTNVLET